MVESSRADILKQAYALNELANTNLRILDSITNIIARSEEVDYYAGLIRRQAFLTEDIHLLFASQESRPFTTPFIICRCILDDYIRLSYILIQDDPKATIIMSSSDAYKKNIKKLDEMAEINEKYIKKEPPRYPNHKLMREIKDQFITTPGFQEYFKDVLGAKEKLIMKSFPSTASIIRSFPEDKIASMFRTFYIWGHFSDYVHFSNFSLRLEIAENPVHCYNLIQESLYYCYKNIILSFEYFEKTFSVKLIDKENLNKFYSLAEEL